MLKSFKTELNPTVEQKIKINKTIGTCRYVYNFYLGHNKTLHDKGEQFMTGKSFSVWLNNEYIPNNPDKIWMREAYSKAVKKSIEDGCTAFTRYFKHQSAFPNFKKKGKSDVKMYFVKNNPKDCRCERHRLNIPTLGWVRMKEKGYIPTTKDGWKIKSGTVSIKADRYYVSVLVEIPDAKIADNSNDGMGIDLGLKDLAIVSNGKTYKNINKSARVKKLEKKLCREQRCLSRKYENLKKGESTQKNIQKQGRRDESVKSFCRRCAFGDCGTGRCNAHNPCSRIYCPGSALSVKLCSRSDDLCDCGGTDPGNVPGGTFRPWNDLFCSGIYGDDVAGCGSWVKITE